MIIPHPTSMNCRVNLPQSWITTSTGIEYCLLNPALIHCWEAGGPSKIHIVRNIFVVGVSADDEVVLRNFFVVGGVACGKAIGE